jgi:hypothetical protein
MNDKKRRWQNQVYVLWGSKTGSHWKNKSGKKPSSEFFSQSSENQKLVASQQEKWEFEMCMSRNHQDKDKCSCCETAKPIVCSSKIGVCVWAQIVKRVVVGIFWNFNTIIWHLYVFDFAHLENFPATCGFLGANNRKNEAVFREFLNGQLGRNFLCYFWWDVFGCDCYL